MMDDKTGKDNMHHDSVSAVVAIVCQLLRERTCMCPRERERCTTWCFLGEREGGRIMIRTLQRLQSHSKHPRQTWQVSPSQRSLDEHHCHQSQVSGHAQPTQAGQDYGRHVVLFRTLDPTPIMVRIKALVDGDARPSACHRHGVLP